MKIKLKERMPFFKDNFSEPIWFEEGELFEVVGKWFMRHDNKEWFKIKSKWFSNPLRGFHNPELFEVIK